MIDALSLGAGSCDNNYFGGVDEGMGAVEAEAVVLLLPIVTMMSVSVTVPGDEEITVTMIEVEGLEAGILVGGVEEAEVLEGGETGVQSGKAVLKGEQRLNNGIGNVRGENLLSTRVVRTMTLTVVPTIGMVRGIETVHSIGMVLSIEMVRSIGMVSPMKIMCINHSKKMGIMTSEGFGDIYGLSHFS